MSTAVRIPAPSFAIERFELACGARLLVDRREGAPVAAVRVHLRGGHSLDPPGLEGTAYLAGRLCDQGTRTHTEEQLALVLEPAAGSLHGSATGVSGTISGDSWKLLVDVVSEVLREPGYPEDKVARQRTRLIDRLLVEQEDHRAQAGHLFRRLVYGDHWLGRPSYGGVESVRRIERKHLAAFQRDHWCGKRAVIGVCGDVDPAAVKRAFDRRLSGWPAGEALVQEEPRLPKPAPRSGVFHADRQQVHAYLGHLGVRRAHPLYPALVVMDHVLGTGPGFSNRISKRLRDEDGLAYTVHADIHSSAGLHPGTFTAYIGTSEEHLERAATGFLEEMRRIRDEPAAADELELAKSYLLGSWALGFERASRRVNYMVSSELYGLPPDNLEVLPRRFAAVTAEDVQAAARERLHPDRPCLAVGGKVTERRVRALLRALATRSR